MVRMKIYAKLPTFAIASRKKSQKSIELLKHEMFVDIKNLP